MPPQVPTPLEFQSKPIPAPLEFQSQAYRGVWWISFTCQDFKRFLIGSLLTRCRFWWFILCNHNNNTNYIKLCFISKYKVTFQNSYMYININYSEHGTKPHQTKTTESIQFSDRKIAVIIFVPFLDNKTMWDYVRLTAGILVTGEWIRTKQQGGKQHTSKPSQHKTNGLYWWWPFKEL